MKPRTQTASGSESLAVEVGKVETQTAGGAETHFKTECAADLQKADIPPVKGVVAGVRPVGLSLIAGRPKCGKSWLELARACAIAQGLPFWGAETEGGDILYLALEDSRARIQARMRTILGDGVPWPSGLHFALEWRKIDRGGLDDLRAWLDAHPLASEVVIDTFPRIRGTRQRGGDSYQADYEEMAALQRLAIEREVAMVCILHTRKMQSDDPFDAVSGTLGTNASADAIEVLTKTKGGQTILHRTSRDFESGAWTLAFDSGLWSCLGETTDGERAEESGAARFLQEYLAGGPVESAKVFDAGRVAGFPKNALYKGKTVAGVVARKGGFGSGAWVWELPKTITVSVCEKE